MCGIAGIFVKDKYLDPQFIIKMTDIIKYRGPDGFGYLGYNRINNKLKTFDSTIDLDSSSEYNLYFGHRRLSIIDLSEAGKQPMSYTNERYWITYNGEIYNYLELKKELINKGYKFHSHTDTEVILAAYEEYGYDCLNKFNGMWSFVILDKKENILFCSRDRLGIKPFYYYWDKNYFAFSSEIKQLLCLPFVEANFNDTAIYNYFMATSYNETGESTFFKGINQLPGGHSLTINLGNIQNLKKQKFWDINLNHKVPTDSNYDELSDKYLELFTDSVKLRLRSDVPVGTALSGGLDSSGIVCMVDDLLKKNNLSKSQKTFTSFSSHIDYDEKKFAEIIIANTSVEPYFTEPAPEKLVLDYKKLIWHHEEPFIGTSIFASWCISELTKQNNVTVTLDGQGPDEMMGGYYPYPSILSEDLRNFKLIKFIKDSVNFKNKLHISPLHILKKTISTFGSKIIPNQYRFNSGLSNIILNDYFKSDIKKLMVLQENNKRYSENYFDNYSYKATMLSPLPGILKQVDRNSMAFSVESRLPFLDYRLVEFVFSLPMKYLVNGIDTKIIYRDALKNILPPEIRKRNTKLGFVTPEPLWIKSNLRELFFEVYNQDICSVFFNKKLLLSSFENYLNGKGDFSSVYWQVFNFLIWYKIFLHDKNIDNK